MTPLSYEEMVLMKSIEKPRAILNSEHLRSLMDLAKQGLVAFGTTLRGEQQALKAAPTARLTGSGQCFLDQALLDLSLRERFGSFRRQVKAVKER
jgi:hypothetical protein